MRQRVQFLLQLHDLRGRRLLQLQLHAAGGHGLRHHGALGSHRNPGVAVRAVVDTHPANCVESSSPLLLVPASLRSTGSLLSPLWRRERRGFLAVWALMYAAMAGFMTALTLRFGPDPHLPATRYIGCTIPAALWTGCLLVSILSCYTTDYIRRGAVTAHTHNRCHQVLPDLKRQAQPLNALLWQSNYRG